MASVRQIAGAPYRGRPLRARPRAGNWRLIHVGGVRLRGGPDDATNPLHFSKAESSAPALQLLPAGDDVACNRCEMKRYGVVRSWSPAPARREAWAHVLPR